MIDTKSPTTTATTSTTTRARDLDAFGSRKMTFIRKSQDGRIHRKSGDDDRFVVTLSLRLMIAAFVPAMTLAFLAGRSARSNVTRVSSIMATSPSLMPAHQTLPLDPPGWEPDHRLHQHSTINSGVAVSTFVPSTGSADSQSCSVQDRPVTFGQHLLVDVENVEKTMLETEDDLKHILHKLLNETDTKSMSSECLWAKPTGATCYGLSPEAHITLQMFRERSVLILSLFSSSTESLLYLVPQLEFLFRPTILTGGSEDGLLPRVKWSYKKRGFDAKDILDAGSKDTIEQDLGMEREKTAVTSLRNGLRRIDVLDLPGSEDRDRSVFVNEVIRSRHFGEAAFHEALVHPAMFLHKRPKRLAVIGGFLGATLREVLKHNTVVEVVLVGVDVELVEAARDYLPEWSDCSNLVGSTISCFDDPRIEFVYDDAASWFVSNYLDEHDIDEEDLFDAIIIVDTMYPTPASDYLLNENEGLLVSLYNSLGDSGVISVPIGRVGKLSDSAFTHKHTLQNMLINRLEDVGFENVVSFSKGHSHSNSPWSFLAIMKDDNLRAKWFSNEAEMNLRILRQSVETKTGETPFHYFDGSTMMSYKFPSRIDEEIYCRQKPKPKVCTRHSFDPEKEHFPSSSFQVKHSGMGEKSGRGVFAKQHIPEGSYIALDGCVNGMFVLPLTAVILDKMYNLKHLPYWKTFLKGYLHGYGWTQYEYGLESIGVDQGIFSFANHGCNGTYNTGTYLLVNEQTAQLGAGPKANGFDDAISVYDAFSDRIYPMWNCASNSLALHDIELGEEVLDNYLVYSGESEVENGDGWEEAVLSLRAMCAGKSIGTITAYEEGIELEKYSSFHI